MTPRRILCAAGLVYVLYGYPGFLPPDAADMLVDSRTGSITDWHSPMFTEVWRVLGRVIAGPAPMFLLVGAGLLFGAYSLLRHRLGDRGAAFGAAGVLLAPPVLSAASLISPDGLLAAALMSSAALLLEASPRQRAAGLAIAVIAASLREGAIVAVIPIVAATWRYPGPRWRQVVVSLIACVAIAGSALGIDRLLVAEPSQRREVALAMTDIAGTLARVSLDDSQIQRVLPDVRFAVTEHLSERAKHVGNAPDRGDKRLFEPAATDRERDALVTGARRLAWEEPAAYLRHRATMLGRELGIHPRHWAPVVTEFVRPASNRLGLGQAARHSVLQRVVEYPVRLLGHTFLFRPWLFAIVLVPLLVLACLRRDGLVAMVAVSALGYELALGIVAAMPEYRDAGWLFAATVLAAIATVKRVSEDRHERVDQKTTFVVADDHRGRDA